MAAEAGWHSEIQDYKERQITEKKNGINEFAFAVLLSLFLKTINVQTVDINVGH